jgi:hypothetical protein
MLVLGNTYYRFQLIRSGISRQASNLLQMCLNCLRPSEIQVLYWFMRRRLFFLFGTTPALGEQEIETTDNLEFNYLK